MNKKTAEHPVMSYSFQLDMHFQLVTCFLYSYSTQLFNILLWPNLDWLEVVFF